MNFEAFSFRHAEVILNEPQFIDQFNEVKAVLDGISDEDLIAKHESYGAQSPERIPKSLSVAINDLIRSRFNELHSGWMQESSIFQDTEYEGDTWRLDFAKKDISIEVAFNHSTVIAWNLIKPVLAGELNHVQKAIQTQIGIIITATENLKNIGGFDGAVGTYSKFLDYLPPLRNVLTVPLLIIGLHAPASFHVEHHQYAPRKKIGRIVRH